MRRLMRLSHRLFPSLVSSPPWPPSSTISLAPRCCRTNILSTLSVAPLLSTANIAPSDEDAFLDFLSGRRTKLTDLAHAVWRKYVGVGDVVVDATCGNGHDTLALLQMVAPPHTHQHQDDEQLLGSSRPLVYAMDIQDSALTSTSALLAASVGPAQRQLVQLFLHCHSKMEHVLPANTSPRLIAFNLGYLPGGDKSIITTPTTTLPALEAASRLVASGGLISLMVYVGHPGGMDELKVIEAFASKLPADLWNSCKFESMNHPASPVLVLLHKK